MPRALVAGFTPGISASSPTLRPAHAGIDLNDAPAGCRNNQSPAVGIACIFEELSNARHVGP
jgi:hypothetical protein